jgi:hypothetical protein
LSENFDGVIAPALPAGWVASNIDPGDGTLWVTSTTTPDTAPNDAFIPDQDGISDKVLITPNIFVSSPSTVLSFRNNFDTEFSDGIYWDGGVLEVSSPNINGGAFTDITDSSSRWEFCYWWIHRHYRRYCQQSVSRQDGMVWQFGRLYQYRREPWIERQWTNHPTTLQNGNR